MAEVKEAPRPKANVTQGQETPTTSLEEGDGRRAGRLARRASSLALRSGSPFAFIRRFAEEMDRLFEDFGIERGLHMPAFLTRGHELLRRETGLIEAEWSPHVVRMMPGHADLMQSLPDTPRGHSRP